MRQMKLAMTYSAALVLAACGGGGSGGGLTLSGKVIDGPISGATVCLDVNSNYACDADEPTATTDARGNYTLPSYSGSVNDKHILAVVPAGAIDLDTNTPITTGYVLMAPASNPSAVTPLTTLVSTQMQVNPSLTATQAEQLTLVSNRLGEQTASLLDKDPTLSTGLHKIAQTVATAIAQTSATLSTNSTFTAAAQTSNLGSTASQAATQAQRLTQSMLLQQMQDSDGSINSAYHNNGTANTNAINSLASSTVNDAINYIAATTKVGKFNKVTMSSAIADGIHAFSIANGGSYLDGSNAVQSIGTRHYKLTHITAANGLNGKFRNINGVWRKSQENNYNLIAGNWVAEYANASGTVASTRNPAVPDGSCFSSPQTPQGVTLTACATSVDLAGKTLADFNFDCKDPAGSPITGCSVSSVFPQGSIGYNFQVIYDQDQYQLYMGNNRMAVDMASFLTEYGLSGSYIYLVGTKIAGKIDSYNSSTKTGTLRWYDNSTGTMSTTYETTKFTVQNLNGIDVFTSSYPNIYYRMGEADQTLMFAYAPAGTSPGSQAGVYRGDKYSSKYATNLYFGLGAENLMNSTAYQFVAGQYRLPALPQ